ncbi:hypothetical protein TA3x_001943 [Tundrisphaera sp. TA3]|uniref:hypothetical protein n=1 Tax=Tundrisphaera sp. TA3 TaxID=3435775 RepID=UPI003EB9A924
MADSAGPGMADEWWLIQDAAEWDRSDDARKMRRTLRKRWPGPEADLDHRLRRYCLACCRRIWPLLPGDPIRMLIEAAERYVEVQDSREKSEVLGDLIELAYHEYINVLEGEDHRDSGRVTYWSREITRIPPDKLRKLLLIPGDKPIASPVEILLDAARFAIDAARSWFLYTTMSTAWHERFLTTHLLREEFGNPFTSTFVEMRPSRRV